MLIILTCRRDITRLREDMDFIFEWQEQWRGQKDKNRPNL